MGTKTPVMTERERVEALLDRRRPDRVPIWSGAYTGYTIAHAYTDTEATYYPLRKVCRDFGWIFFPWMSYASFGTWEFGGEVRMPNGEFDSGANGSSLPHTKG
jgi:uroporphyrinogen decarboxylase